MVVVAAQGHEREEGSEKESRRERRDWEGSGGGEREIVPPHPGRICPIMLPRGTPETINPR